MRPVYYLVVGILIVIAAAPIVLFTIQFAHLSLSEDPTDWGEAGDYFGGFLNPIVSLMGLMVTIYIAFYVHRLSERQGKDQIDIQKKLLKTQFEYKLLTDIQDDLVESVDRISHELSQHVTSPGSLVDDLIHDLEYLRSTDSSILRIPDEVVAKLQETISQLEIWKGERRMEASGISSDAA